ncbi:hypothetical protein T09_3561 [Trichinella sp. T9]|nr:hypothetical protein T09_3561 [Trichinella sp. T9]
MTYDPMVILTIGNQNCVDRKAKHLLYHGQNIIVLYIIARKFGEDIELLSVLDQTNNLKFPKIHVEQKHNPMDTDTSWIETTVFSVWDKEQTHIGSMERFVPVDGLSLTWRKVEKDVMESLNKKSNFKTDETHSKFKLKKYIPFLPLLCLYGTVFLALLPIAIPFFITLLIAKRFK